MAFDLEKLKEFDPKGIAEFKKTHDIPDKQPRKQKQKSKGIDR